ncbi:MAG TPA: MFS transporter [Solirubrobacterales bacterium]|nr:MFS transporter [Solirubrobacterales bacterium]
MSAGDRTTGTIETRIPGRLDRLPWSRFHWRVVIGLGTVWILDGLEVTIIGFLAPTLVAKGSGIDLTNADIALAASIYIAGACLGALFFGQLTDRFGRKKLFLLTLLVYLGATVATAFAFAPWFFFVARFLTGAGIGGEYAAINSAIDELIPARARGRVDLIINGSYWLGAAGGALLSLILLDQSIFAADVGWRVAFGMGAVLGLAILFVRRHVPESPRWLFIHGREEDAERIVDGIEREVEEETGEDLEDPEGDPIEVRQRKRIPFREIARTAFRVYPKRSVLGLSLFIGQAFLYNAVTFTLGLTLTTYLGVASNKVGIFYAVFALGNFLGPLLLGRLFDTVGRRPMIAGCYLTSAVLLVVVAVLFSNEAFSDWGLIAALGVTFFFASAGASSAYLTVSEIFPMEVRALAIAFYYAIGTAIGGIIGPQVFERLASTNDPGQVAIGYMIGAVVMAIGGIVEIFLGVKAEQQQLEDIAKPLTVEDAEGAEEESEEQRSERERIEERHRSREQRHRQGRRRYRPGPGSVSYSPFAGFPTQQRQEWLDVEVDRIAREVGKEGEIDTRTLAASLGASRWGPGRYRAALREAVEEGAIVRIGRNRVAPAGRGDTAGS